MKHDQITKAGTDSKTPIPIEGDFAQAVVYFEKAIEISKGQGKFYTESYFGLADIYWIHRHKEKAIDLLEKIAENERDERNKHFIAACNHLANYYQSIGQFEKAIKYYEKFMD